MVDISMLEITGAPETVAPEDYQLPATGFDPVPEAIYPVKFTDGKFKVEDQELVIRPGKAHSKKDGLDYFSAEYMLEVTQGKYTGRKLFGRANNIPYRLVFNDVEAGRTEANSLEDIVRAAGFTGSVTGSAQDKAQILGNALESLALKGVGAKAKVTWSAFCNPNSKDYAGCGHTIRGMKNFPLLPSGEYEPRVTCPSGNHVDGTAPLLLAKAEVRNIYPLTKKL